MNNTPSKKTKQCVRRVTVEANQDGQRIDNFLARELKNVPRTYLYRILRKGEVRVNRKRVKPSTKLTEGDVVRIPPVYLDEKKPPARVSDALINQMKAAIVLEDEQLIVLDKPAGMAVHGGSGVRFGLIESFRQARSDLAFVELVHRLDKETSGLVMLAKNRPTLLALHELIREGEIEKHYLTLVAGQWHSGHQQLVDQLEKRRANKKGNKQKVRVVSDNPSSAKRAVSIVKPQATYCYHEANQPATYFSLIDVQIKTGRMHQIRTQLASRGYPLLGDSQYGDFAANRRVKKIAGLKRLFLHSFSLSFRLPTTGKVYQLRIPLADDLTHVLEKLKRC